MLPPRRVAITEVEAVALVVAAAVRLGASDDDAMVIARHLVDDELRGAVGMSRLLIVASDVERNGIQECTPIAVGHQTDVTAMVDGGWHHGLVVAERATELAVSKAQRAGIAVVGANNHRYSGTLGYYAEMVARRGLIAIAFASGSFGSVAPYGARAGRLDTNPMACGFPTTGEPIVWDIATSAISGSEVYRRLTTGETLPAGVAVDAAGAPTRDPAAALAGAILPWGGHRGSGLAMAIRLIGLLCGVQPFAARDDDFAFLIIVIDPARFLTTGQFQALAAEFAAGIRETPPAVGFAAVRVPYDRSMKERERRRREGIDLPAALYDRLVAIAQAG